MKKPALFLDRDGVINIDHAYVHKKRDFHFIDGIFELCRHAQNQGYLIVVVTNQAGIGRGYYTENDFSELTDWMIKCFADEGVNIRKVYHCPYHPEHGIGEYRKDADCRKPKPGMMLNAADELALDLKTSLMIGDNEKDMQAARNAGINTRLLLNPTMLLAGSMYCRKTTEATGVLSELTDAITYIQ